MLQLCFFQLSVTFTKTNPSLYPSASGGVPVRYVRFVNELFFWVGSFKINLFPNMIWMIRSRKRFQDMCMNANCISKLLE